VVLLGVLLRECDFGKHRVSTAHGESIGITSSSKNESSKITHGIGLRLGACMRHDEDEIMLVILAIWVWSWFDLDIRKPIPYILLAFFIQDRGGWLGRSSSRS
jgi:hypothetical protein